MTSSYVNYLQKLIVGFAIFVFASNSFAASGISYQGRILKPDGSPLTGATVQFKLQLRSPDANNCLMYEEQQILDMRNSNGVFAITMNDGNGSRTDATGLSIDRVFSNAQGTANAFTFNPATCSSGSTYTAGTGDGRSLVVLFKDETMASFEPMPSQKINFAPLAFEAKQIAGFTPASLVRVAEADGTLGTVSPLSNANYTELLALINGTTAQYEKTGKISGNTVPAMTSGQVLGWNGSAWTSVDPIATVQPFAKTALPVCTAGQFLKDNGANGFTCAAPAGAGTVTSVATGAGLTGGPITSTGTIALATLGVGGTGFKVTYDTYGRVTGAVALVEADIPALSTAGKVVGSAITSGTIGGTTAINTSGNIVTTGTISSGTITSSGLITSPSLSSTAIGTQSVQIFETTNSFKVTLQAPASLGANYALTLPTTAGGANQVLTTNGTGTLTWTTPAGTGISALTGDVTASGSGSVAAAVAQVGGVNAANVASGANAANAATNLNTFSTIVKRDSAGAFTAGNITAGVFTSTSVSTGAVTGTSVTLTSSIFKDSGANTVTVQAPTTVTTSYILKLPPAVAVSAGQVLSSDTSGNLSWFTLPTSAAPSGAAGGDLSGTYPNPSVASVGGSTAANVNLATIAANAATNASTNSAIVKRDGAGSFAANVATVNGVALNNAGSILNITNPVGGAWNMVLPATAGSNGQVMQTNGTGVMSWIMPLTSATGFVNGGNTFGAISNLGNNDNFDLNVKTNNLNRMTVTAAGNVGIGTTAPVDKFSITGASSSLNSTDAFGSYFYVTEQGDPTKQAFMAYNGSGNNGSSLHALPNAALFESGSAATNGVAVIAKNASAPIRFATGGAALANERMRIDSTGYVGIGTTAPYSQLQIDGVGGDLNIESHRTGWNKHEFSTDSPLGSNSVSLYFTSNASGAFNSAGIGMDTDGSLRLTGGGNLGAPDMVITDAAKVGIGTTAPATKFEVVGTLKVGDGGETCGATFAGGVRYNGGNIQFCNGATWSTLGVAGSGITALTGDVTATGTGSVVATVANVGGVTAANIATGANLANAATNVNTFSTLVKRDGAGGFSASAITHTTSVFKDSGANTVTMSAPTTVTASYNLKLPVAVPGSAGQVLASDTAGNTSWYALPAALPPNGAAGGDLSGTYPAPSVATVGGSTAANVNTATVAANAATAANTVSTIVKRDVSGNFIANVATVNGLSLNNAGSILNITNPVGGAWNMVLPATAGSNGQVMQTNGAGVMSWTTPLTASSGFMNGGNSFGANSYFGNNDNFDLNVKTNGITRMTVTAAGNIGVGTGAPVVPLDVYGAVRAFEPSIGVGVSLNAHGTAADFVGLTTNNNADALLGVNLTLTGTSLVTPKAHGVLSGAGMFIAGNGSLANDIGFYTSAAAATTAGAVSPAIEALVIKASGKVGIGTTAPAYKLDVTVPIVDATYDGLRITNLSYTQNGYAMLDFFNSNASANFSSSRIYSHIGGGGVASKLHFAVADPSKVLQDRMVIDVSGNVGVGTTAPATKLEVAGTLKLGDGGEACGASYAGSVRYNGGSIQFCNGTAWGSLATSAASYSTGSTIQAATGTAAVPSLSFSGNTSTGLYNPSANVIGVSAGGINIFNMSSAGIVSPTTGGAALTTANGTAAAPTYAFTGSLNTGWFSPSASQMAASTAGVERVRIDNSGNFGIGTSTPNNPLDVMGVAQISDNTFTASGSVVTGPAATDNVRLNLMQNVGGGANIVMGGAAGSGGNPTNPKIYFADAKRAYASISGLAPIAGTSTNHQGGDILLSTTPDVSTTNITERMRVTAAGSVGIGTTSPGYPLEVNGSIASNDRIYVTKPGYIPSYITMTGVGPDNGNFEIWTRHGGYSKNLDITSNQFIINGAGQGNVGIGTTAPGYKLEAIGSVGVSGSVYTNTINGGYAQTNPDGLLIYNAYNNIYPFITLWGGLDASKVRINTSSKVIAPTVDDTWTFGSPTNRFNSISIGSGVSSFGGSVGIGTAAPAATLDVNGTVSAKAYIGGGNNAGAAVAIDWSQGNNQYTTASCGAMTFTNMSDGGTYNLTVQGTTAGVCSFSQAGLTFYLPPNHGTTTGGTMTVYSFIRNGTKVMVAWSPGY